MFPAPDGVLPAIGHARGRVWTTASDGLSGPQKCMRICLMSILCLSLMHARAIDRYWHIYYCAIRAVPTKPLKFRSRKKGRFPIHSYMDGVLIDF